MNDSHQSCVQLSWWIRWIIAHIEIHSTLHKKRMILKRVVLSYSDDFTEIRRTLRSIAHYIRNEWFSLVLCWTILINSKELPQKLRFIAHYTKNEWMQLQFCAATLKNTINYPTHWDLEHIIKEMNDFHQRCVQLFRWTRWINLHIDIQSILNKKWIILSTVLFSYSHEFKKLCHTLIFIAHYKRN